MRSLLRVLLCAILFAAQSQPQIIIIAKKKAGGGSCCVDTGIGGSNSVDAPATTIASSAMNTAIGDLVVCGSKWEGTTTADSAADTAGNTYTPLTAANNSGSDGEPHTRSFYSIATAANASNVVTITFSGSTPYKRVICRLFTGATSIDTQSTAGEATTGTAVASGALTTSVANTLVWAMVAGYTVQTFSAPLIGGVTSTTSTTLSDTIAHWKIFTSTQSSITANMTQSASDRWTTIAAAFK